MRRIGQLYLAVMAVAICGAVNDLSAQGWSEPVALTSLNSLFADSAPFLTKDGLSLYFSSTRPGTLGGADIWVAERSDRDDPWGAPVNLGATINSVATDNFPHVSRDGHTLYLVSQRAGGFGGNDIYVSHRNDVKNNLDWSTPVNLGPTINTAFADTHPSLFESDELTELYFASNRVASAGFEIFRSILQADGSFGAPQQVAEVNSPNDDNFPSVLHTGLEIWIFSNRDGGVGSPSEDLYYSVRASVHDPWSAPINPLGPINTAAVETFPGVSKHGNVETLLFSRCVLFAPPDTCDMMETARALSSGNH